MSENTQTYSVAAATEDNSIQQQSANEQYTWDAVPEPHRKRPKLRSRHRKLKFILFLLAALLLAAAGMTIDFKSAITSNTSAPAADIAAIGKILQINIDNNRDQKLLNMYFSENDVNTIVSGVSQKILPANQVTAQWSNGSVNGVISVPLYKAYINIYYSAVPVLKDGKLSLDLRSCKVGRLPLPGKIRNMIVRKIDGYCQNNAVFIQAQNALKKLDITADNAMEIALDIDQQPNPVYSAEASQDEKKLEQAIESLLLPINDAAEKQAASCKVLVKTENINTLLEWLITNNWENVRQNNEPYLYVVWQNSGLQIYGKYVNKYDVYYNLSLHVTPQFNDGKITMKVNSCRIGKIDLPAQKIEKLIQDQLDPLFGTQGELSDMLKMLLSLTAQADGIEFEVEPTAASELLKGIF